MITNSSVFLQVLPELLQLILINGLLLFAMLFSYVSDTKSTSTEITSEIDGLFKPYAGKHMTPTLQTESIVGLMIVSLLCSAMLYLNSHLTYALAYGLIWDDLGRFMSIFLCISAIAALGLGAQALKRFSRYEFILILWLSVIGMLCLIKSYSFLAFYLSIELQSLSFYMLSAMRSRTEASAEAGLKYFILSAFSSAMLLLGMTLIYGSIGSQSFGDLGITIDHFLALEHIYGQQFASLYVGLGCICISLLFKLGAAPFHAWIADVYEGSHTAITAWFAITAKIAVATALIRINTPDTLVYLLTAVAAISLFVGSLSAMRQVKLKRLMAFSAVANAGWFILALTSGQWQLMVIHLMVYTLLSVNLFSIFILPLFRTHPSLGYRTRILNREDFSKADLTDHGADSSTIKYISDLNQIYKVNPSLAFAVTISMFSLAGIPPLAGFYSKYLIINAVTQAEHYLILAVALSAAVISTFYYIRMIKTIYFSVPSPHVPLPLQGQRGQWWFTFYELPTNAYITALTTGLTMVFFIKPDYFCIWLALI